MNKNKYRHFRKLSQFFLKNRLSQVGTRKKLVRVVIPSPLLLSVSQCFSLLPLLLLPSLSSMPIPFFLLLPYLITLFLPSITILMSCLLPPPPKQQWCSQLPTWSGDQQHWWQQFSRNHNRSLNYSHQFPLRFPAPGWEMPGDLGVEAWEVMFREGGDLCKI